MSNNNTVCVVRVNMMDVRFKTPANFYISGQSQSGKSYLVRSMLRHAEELFNPVPTKIIYCYGIYQKEFEEMLQSMSNLTLMEGFSDNLCEMNLEEKI
jgi:ABC-type proline/glycine betaine transport system ATPase subunit